MSGNNQSEFAGIWYPTFQVDENQMFVTKEQYMTTTDLSTTTLNIVISETSFYIQNHQAPIAKRPEIIFHNLLFTIVCLELFGLVFLIFKLIIIPLFDLVDNRRKNNRNIQVRPANSCDGEQELKEERWAHQVEH